MKPNNNIIITSILCLIPIFFSFIIYDDLPSQIAIHWDNHGNPDNYVPKAFAAFGIPIFFFIVNIYSKIQLLNDPKKINHSKQLSLLSIWLLPLLSFILTPVTLLIATDYNIPIYRITPVFTGALLITIGNYLPKSRQNYTIGIKLPWTLHDLNNWNKTHRFAGFLWIIGGLIILVDSLVNFNSDKSNSLLIITIIITLTILPLIYSYLLYKKSDI